MQQSLPRLFLLVSTCAILFLLITGYQVFLWQQFKQEYEKTTGIIIKNKIDKERKFYPVVRFKTLHNQKVTFTAQTLASKIKYSEGDTIQIYYDLLNTDDVHIAGEEYRNILIYSALTLLFALIAGYMYWQNKEKIDKL
jgi:cytochrome c oxidase assembly protein Cox11